MQNTFNKLIEPEEISEEDYTSSPEPEFGDDI